MNYRNYQRPLNWGQRKEYNMENKYGLYYDITENALLTNFVETAEKFGMSVDRITTIVYNTMDLLFGWKKGAARNYGAIQFRYDALDFYSKARYKRKIGNIQTVINILQKLLPKNGEWNGTYKELHDYGKGCFTKKEIPTCFWSNFPTSMLVTMTDAKDKINAVGIFTNLNKYVKYTDDTPVTISTVDPSLEIRENNKRLIYDTTICDINIDIDVMLGILKNEDVYDIAKSYGLSSDDVLNVVNCVIAQELGISVIQVQSKDTKQLRASGWIERTIISLVKKGRG